MTDDYKCSVWYEKDNEYRAHQEQELAAIQTELKEEKRLERDARSKHTRVLMNLVNRQTERIQELTKAQSLDEDRIQKLGNEVAQLKEIEKHFLVLMEILQTNKHSNNIKIHLLQAYAYTIRTNDKLEASTTSPDRPCDPCNLDTIAVATTLEQVSSQVSTQSLMP